MSIANYRSTSETNDDDGRFHWRSRSPPPDNDDKNRQRTRSRSRGRWRGGGKSGDNCDNTDYNTNSYRGSSSSGRSDKSGYNDRGGSGGYGNEEDNRKDSRDNYRRRSRSRSRSRSRRRSESPDRESDRGGNSRRPSEMNSSSNGRNSNYSDRPRGGESKVVAQAESKEIEPEFRIPDCSRDSANVSSSFSKSMASNPHPKADYGLSGALGGGGSNNKNEASSETASDSGIVQKQLPNFGVSGALAGDAETGNTKNGVILKYQEPEEAGIPSHQWRLYVFKDEGLLETLHISKLSCYLIGKDDRVCDILTPHLSISKQHAVIQFRKRNIPGSGMEVRPYIMDLGSTNKTFLNGDLLEDARYYELREKDCLKFGLSSREYVLLHGDSSKSSK